MTCTNDHNIQEILTRLCAVEQRNTLKDAEITSFKSELFALQKENFGLQKEIFSCQKENTKMIGILNYILSSQKVQKLVAQNERLRSEVSTLANKMKKIDALERKIASLQSEKKMTKQTSSSTTTNVSKTVLENDVDDAVKWTIEKINAEQKTSTISNINFFDAVSYSSDDSDCYDDGEDSGNPNFFLPDSQTDPPLHEAVRVNSSDVGGIKPEVIDECESSVLSHDDSENNDDDTMPEKLRICTLDSSMIDGINIDPEMNHARRDKKHYCLFCEKPLSKILRHLLTQHSSEPRMQAYFNAVPGNRPMELKKLRMAGDHRHNTKILKEGKGTLVIQRRKSYQYQSKPAIYVTCEDCHGLYQKQELWRHRKNCVMKT